MTTEGEIVALAHTLAMKVVRDRKLKGGQKIASFTTRTIQHEARFLIRTDPWYGQLAKSVIEAVLKHGEAKR